MLKLIRVTTVPLSLNVLLRGQMKFMKENGFEVIMVSAEGKELETVKANEQCEHIIVPMTRAITPFRDLVSLYRLTRLFRKLKPAIVHSHTPKAGLLAMLAARFAGVPIRIHTVAGLRFMTAGGLTRQLLVMMEKMTGRAATHIWPNSFSLLQYIRNNKLAVDRKLKVIGRGSSNGVDLKRYSVPALKTDKINDVKSSIQYDEKLIYILSVGRIVKDKGIEELVKVFIALHTKYPQLRLIVVGAYEAQLDPVQEETIKIIDQHPAIIHIDWSDAVEYYMHLANFLIHPSHREGFPNVLLQAGAMKCPIVCSRIEGNVDIAEHAETGLLFEMKNETDLLQKMEHAILNPDKMAQYAINLRLKIEQYYDQPVVHQFLLREYQSLIKSSI